MGVNEAAEAGNGRIIIQMSANVLLIVPQSIRFFIMAITVQVLRVVANLGENHYHMTTMTLDALIGELQKSHVLKTPRIIEAFRRIDRRLFVVDEFQERAYADFPLPIGYGQTISQPTVVAMMLELVQPKPGERCLDIGMGSGWVAALLAEIVGDTGRVYGIERIPELAERASALVGAAGKENITVINGDGSRGWDDQAPYDVIHIAAAAPSVHPGWKKQLTPGGRLVVPVGEVLQDLVLITKIGDNRYMERHLSGFQFVPLMMPQ